MFNSFLTTLSTTFSNFNSMKRPRSIGDNDNDNDDNEQHEHDLLNQEISRVDDKEFNWMHCPLTTLPMIEPVTLSCGCTYDREAIRVVIAAGITNCPSCDVVMRAVFDPSSSGNGSGGGSGSGSGGKMKWLDNIGLKQAIKYSLNEYIVR